MFASFPKLTATQISFTLLLGLAVSCRTSPDASKPIAIQPLGLGDTTGLGMLATAIERGFSRRVTILPSVALPATAINRSKGQRYSADSLLEYLANQQADTIAYTLGITDADIFVTKRDAFGAIKKPEAKYAVFGIFGLARRPGSACILSRHRLRRSASKALVQERVRRVAIHELGHNRGIRHCTDKSCVMTSAVEKLSTIDKTSGRFCNRCSRKLH